MDYGAISYFLSAGDFNEVDACFAELHHKIKLLEHHTQTTFELYEQEKIVAQKRLKAEYDPLIAAADERYDAAREEIIGDDSVKDSFAEHESDWGYLVAKYAAECEISDQRFADMANVLYTSQIISVYVLLEAEMKRLCNAWQKLTGHRIALTDFGHRDYLGSSMTYLEKVVGINMPTLQTFENKLKDLQNLRNRLIHDGGLITAEQLKDLKKLVESSKGGLKTVKEGADHLLRITNVLYVREWFSVLRAFFEQLFWLIDASMGNRFLSNRLQYLFGFINRYASVDITKVVLDKPQREVHFMLNCTDPAAPFDAEVVLEIKGAVEQKLTVVNKIAGNPAIDRFKKVIDENNGYFWRRAVTGFLLKDVLKKAAIVIR